jgi:DNA-binding NarL/FixJ family response regulator
MKDPPSVLIAEDYPVFALGLQTLLGPGRTVVGVVEDGNAVVEAVVRLQPDLLLLDLSLPNLSGEALVRAVRNSAPATMVLVVNATSSEGLVARCLELGARGFVAKTARPEELLEAIDSVLGGASAVVAGLGPAKAAERTTARDPEVSRLTRRLQDVLDLIGKGLTASRIADCLGIAERTVEHHRAELRRKLKSRSAADLYRVALAFSEARDQTDPLRWKDRLSLPRGARKRRKT